MMRDRSNTCRMPDRDASDLRLPAPDCAQEARTDNTPGNRLRKRLSAGRALLHLTRTQAVNADYQPLGRPSGPTVRASEPSSILVLTIPPLAVIFLKPEGS
jgi:hypothetical protein